MEELQGERRRCAGGEEAHGEDRVTQREGKQRSPRVRRKSMTLIVKGEERRCVRMCVYRRAGVCVSVCACSKLALTRLAGCDIN